MKKALVTGSSRGIGAAIARTLASDGWSVTINYLNSAEKAGELARMLGAEAIRCDVSDSAQVRAMFERTGDVDLLVNNAGIAWSGLLSDMSDEEWSRILGVNLGGVFNCCRAAIPGMVRKKRGCIVQDAGTSMTMVHCFASNAVCLCKRGMDKKIHPTVHPGRQGGL